MHHRATTKKDKAVAHNAVINRIISWLAYSIYYLVPPWETTDLQFLRLALSVKCNKPKHFQRDTHMSAPPEERILGGSRGSARGSEQSWTSTSSAFYRVCFSTMGVWERPTSTVQCKADCLNTLNSLWHEGRLIWVGIKSWGQGSIDMYPFATAMAARDMMHYM